MVIDGDIDIFRKSKKELLQQIESKKLMKSGGNYDYLLNIKTYQYTNECVKEFETCLRNKKNELGIIKQTTPIGFWLADLE